MDESTVRHTLRAAGITTHLQNGGTMLQMDENADIATQQGGILQLAVDMEQIVEVAARQRHLPATMLRFGQFYLVERTES